MSLASAKLGSRCRITNVRPDGALSFRLMEMGFVEGAEVQIIRRAPLGDPLQVRVGDYELSLRSNEAHLVDVDTL